MLTDVRQRVQHEQQGRRGLKVDPAWAHRRLLLRAGDQLGPTIEISAAWGIKSCCLRRFRRTARPGTAATRPRRAGSGSSPRAWAPTCAKRPDLRPRSRVVARHRRVPTARQHERPDRGLQRRQQADQTRRLRFPYGQVDAPLHRSPAIADAEPYSSQFDTSQCQSNFVPAPDLDRRRSRTLAEGCPGSRTAYGAAAATVETKARSCRRGSSCGTTTCRRHASTRHLAFALFCAGPQRQIPR